MNFANNVNENEVIVKTSGCTSCISDEVSYQTINLTSQQQETLDSVSFMEGVDDIINVNFYFFFFTFFNI